MKYAPKNIAIDWLNTIWETRLPYQSKYLACYLRKFMNSQNDMAWPSYSRMVEETGLSKMTISRYLKILEDEEWIIRNKGKKGKNTIYTVCFPSSITQILLVDKSDFDQNTNKTTNKGSTTQIPCSTTQVLTSTTQVHELNKELNKELNNSEQARIASPSEINSPDHQNIDDDSHSKNTAIKKPGDYKIVGLATTYIKQGDQLRFIKVFGKRGENKVVYDCMLECLQRLSEYSNHEPVCVDSAIGYCNTAIAKLKR